MMSFLDVPKKLVKMRQQRVNASLSTSADTAAGSFI
jgi:hypothetical protein